MRTFLAKFAAVAAAPLLAATLGTGTAHADTRSIWGEVRFANGYCLDVSGGNFATGATVQIWGCNGTEAQQFSLYPADATHFEIHASGSTNGHVLCVNNWEGGDTVGNHMRLYPCTESSAYDKWFNWVHKGNGRQMQPKIASANCVNSWGGLYQGAQARLFGCYDAPEENIVSAPIFPV